MASNRIEKGSVIQFAHNNDKFIVIEVARGIPYSIIPLEHETPDRFPCSLSTGGVWMSYKVLKEKAVITPLEEIIYGF